MWGFWAELFALTATVMLCWPAYRAGELKITRIRLKKAKAQRQEQGTTEGLGGLLEDIQNALDKLDDDWTRRDQKILYLGLILISLSSVIKIVLLLINYPE